MQNALCPIRDRGRTNAVPPLARPSLTAWPSRRQITPSAILGWSHLALLRFSGKPLREVFRRAPLPPCTNRRLS